jgi:hypothetical protein
MNEGVMMFPWLPNVYIYKAIRVVHNRYVRFPQGEALRSVTDGF